MECSSAVGERHLGQIWKARGVGGVGRSGKGGENMQKTPDALSRFKKTQALGNTDFTSCWEGEGGEEQAVEVRAPIQTQNWVWGPMIIIIWDGG